MSLEIIPALDLRDGRVVRLEQGDFARETAYGIDAVEQARRYRDAGARRLHVVDLDGAREGNASKLRLIGSPLGQIHQDKPGHGSVVTLRPGPAWRVETVWEPGESPRFGEKSGLRVLQTAESPEDPTSA